MNVLLAFLIYAMILLVWGERKIPVSSIKYGLEFTDSLMFECGFKNGDKILAVNDEAVEDYQDIPAKLFLGDRVTIERDHQIQNIKLPVDLIGKLVKKKRSKAPIMTPRIPILVKEVADTSPAMRAGLKPGDKIVAVNQIPTIYFDQFRETLAKDKNQDVVLGVIRGSDSVNLNVHVSNEGKIGFATVGGSLMELDSIGVLKVEVVKYNILQAIPGGVRLAGEKLQYYIDQFKKILSPKTGAYKGVGGFVSMGSIFPSGGWDWEAFWNITAFFSIILAFMNLLPIPALDGGHVLFTLIEIVTGRKPSDKFLEYAQIVGMVILFGLLIYANGNDLFGWGRK